MSRKQRASMALIATALVAVSAGMLIPVQPADATPPYPGALTGGGSSWVYPAMNQWISDVTQNGMNINYQNTGSSIGRADFANATYDFGASEIPYGVTDGTIQDPPPASRGYVYMPDVAGGTTFMYNLTEGTQRITDLRLSGSVVAQIFTGVITNWDDPQIAADNPGLNLPSLQITPVVRSDGAGSTADFTAWMLATQSSWWQKYCTANNWEPCTATSVYPVGSDPNMKAEPLDGGVAGTVSQPQANGSIGYTEYAYAIEDDFPVAKVLNAAGYYTEPTPGHIAVSLLDDKLNMTTSSPLYLTQDLSGVYTDTDPRTYELSAYSYMILPTDTSGSFTTSKGNTLGDFGQYLLCKGQSEVDTLGYSALPINLVEAGYAQLAKIPGNTVPTATTSIIQGCDNPTFSTNGTNTLADTDPDPPACDKQGATMCTTATGGAPGSGGAAGGDPNTGASPSPSASSGSSGSSGSGSSGSTGSTGSSGTGSKSSGSTGSTGSSGTGSKSSGSSGTGSTGTGSSGTGSSGTGSTGTGSTGTGSTGTGSTGTGSSGTGSTGTGSTGTGSTGTASTGTGSGQNCDASTGICSATTSGDSTASNGTASNGTANNGTSDTSGQSSGSQPVYAEPVGSPSSLGDGVQVALMVLAAALLVGLGLAPALIGQINTRRRQRRGPGPYGPGDWR